MTDPRSAPGDPHVPVAPVAGSLRARAADYVTLAKPRLNILVVVTALAGYYMGVIGPAHTWVLVHMLIGTTLVASGSAVFNQLIEIEADGLVGRGLALRHSSRRPPP